MAQTVKRLSATQETWVRSLGWEDPLEKEMAAHSSILAWKIPWTEEPGWTRLSDFTSLHSVLLKYCWFVKHKVNLLSDGFEVRIWPFKLFLYIQSTFTRVRQGVFAFNAKT